MRHGGAALPSSSIAAAVVAALLGAAVAATDPSSSGVDITTIGTGSPTQTIPSTGALVGAVAGGLSLLTLCLASALVLAVAAIYGWRLFGRRVGGVADEERGSSGIHSLLDLEPARPTPSMVVTHLAEAPSSDKEEDDALAALTQASHSGTPAHKATLRQDASWHDCLIEPDQIQILRRRGGEPWCLGGGAYGQALYDGVQVVAVKVLTGLGDERVFEAFVREAAILRNMRDKNIVQFVGICPGKEEEGHQDEAMMVQEYMEAGDLMKALQWRDAAGRRVYGFYGRGRKAAMDVARGLHYLHSHRVIHLDIKSNNVLLARDGSAKIADVGLARNISKTFLTSPAMGTFAWSSPEVLTGQPVTTAADIYSFGIVIWEIVTGEIPTRGRMRSPLVPDECPQAAADIITQCLSQDPAQRPTAREILHRLELVPGSLSRNLSRGRQAPKTASPTQPGTVPRFSPVLPRVLPHGEAGERGTQPASPQDQQQQKKQQHRQPPAEQQEAEGQTHPKPQQPLGEQQLCEPPLLQPEQVLQQRRPPLTKTPTGIDSHAVGLTSS